MASLGSILQAGHEIIIVHGNGPQVGNMLFEAKSPVTLFLLYHWMFVGLIRRGYGLLFATVFTKLLRREGIERDVTAVVTQVIVDQSDPELAAPIKGVGPFFDGERAQNMAIRAVGNSSWFPDEASKEQFRLCCPGKFWKSTRFAA